jgi:hypothetical protein
MKPQTDAFLHKSRAGPQSQGGGVGMLMKVPGLFDCYAVTTLPSRFSGTPLSDFSGRFRRLCGLPAYAACSAPLTYPGFLMTPKLSWSDAALSGLNPGVAIITLL